MKEFETSCNFHICQNPNRRTRFDADTSDRICNSLYEMQFCLGARGGGFIDCMGLIIRYMREFGISIPNSAVLEDWEKYDEPDSYLSKLFRKLARDETPELGDILIFHHRFEPGRVGHSAVCLGGGNFIHAGVASGVNPFLPVGGVFICDFEDSLWKGRLYTGFRFRE